MITKLLSTIAVLATALTTAANAATQTAPKPPQATITVTQACDGNCHVVLVDGDIGGGDADRFKEAIDKNKVQRAVVVLNSLGGSMFDGLDIGEFVRERGFATFVRSGDKCVSACANIWIAGSTQYFPKEGKARIGFHGSYLMATNRDGTVVKSAKPEADPGGNAVVGAYLNQLGFGYKTILALTSAGPNDALWLTTEKQAQQLGFTYKYHPTSGNYDAMAAGNYSKSYN